ncbi:MAG: hypothetical protein MJY80_07425 [Bacteroidales bacterium]|nr:hypothetical protein [Bacteroidales bacterium]
MKNCLTYFSLAVLTIGLLASCSKINERLDGLDKRINNLENDKIASVEQQIAAINQSIADLGTIRTNIQTLMEAKTVQGEENFRNPVSHFKTGSKLADSDVCQFLYLCGYE